MSGKFGIVAAVIIISAALAGGIRDIFGGDVRRSSSSKSLSTQETINTAAGTADHIEGDYDEAIKTVTANYAGDVDYEKATQAAIQGMLSSLDPHSMFFSRAEFNKLKEDQDSRFYGIGVTILRHRDGVYVQSAVEGTPASRAGLRYGDRIVEVDGKDARDWSSEEVSKNVRGDRGKEVRIKVERAGAQAPLNFNIIRDAVPLPSISNSYMIRPGVGYVALSRGFQHTTGDELQDAISSLKSQGMRQMMLDLRNNPGGLLNQAIEVASEFLPRGQTIVSVRGRGYSQSVVHKSKGTDPEELPLVVLINRNSASASEIVAGAIQDHGRGLVVGETSFGKALVQQVFQLPFGTGLTLTTAKYYTPYGRSIQRDYSNGSLYDYYVRHDEDGAGGQQPQTPASPTGQQPTATPQPPPPQHGPAVKTAAGRVFYGGGGITPDIEVKPLAATPLRGRIVEATFFFTRELIAGQFPGLESYRVEKPETGRAPRPTDFPITTAVVEAFRSYIQRDPTLGIQPAQLDTELDFVKLRIRDEVITAAFSSDAGNRVLLESDPQTLRAIEALPEAKRLAESIRNGIPVS